MSKLYNMVTTAPHINVTKYLYPLLSIAIAILAIVPARTSALMPPTLTQRNVILHNHRPTSSNIAQQKSSTGRSSSSSSTKLSASNNPIDIIRGGATLFNNAPFQRSLQALAYINGIGTLISMVTGSHVHLDLLGTGAFAVAAIASISKSTSTQLLPRHQVSTAAVSIWSVKLASFLFYRALQVHHDARLTDTLGTAGGTLMFWFISFLWGVLCSLPHTLGVTSSLAGKNKISLGIGSIVYISGLIVETLADYQKWQFKKLHPGKFCNVGLWSVSQHPNFFGNMVLWAGIFIMNLPALIEPSTSGVGVGVGSSKASWVKQIGRCLWRFRRVGFALISPWFMWTLFSGQTNGTITNAVELVAQKYGSDPDFVEYTKSVPLIVPKMFL